MKWIKEGLKAMNENINKIKLSKQLEIDGMRMCIVRYCIKTTYDKDDCKECKIANLCSRNIREPRYNYCLDWHEERVRDAYKIIK